MAAIRRGVHQAGTSQINPSSNATKNLVPKANGMRPRERKGAPMADGTSEPVNMASLGDLDGCQHLLNHLIGRETLQVRFRLQYYAMAKNRKRGGLHVVGKKKVAASHAG